MLSSSEPTVIRVLFLIALRRIVTTTGFCRRREPVSRAKSRARTIDDEESFALPFLQQEQMTISHIEARFIEPMRCLAVKQLPQQLWMIPKNDSVADITRGFLADLDRALE